MKAGAGNDQGGELYLTGGRSSEGASGDLGIASSDGAETGDVVVKTGESTRGNSGELSITTGHAANSAGSISLCTGQGATTSATIDILSSGSSNGRGGGLTLASGTGTSGGHVGIDGSSIALNAGSSAGGCGGGVDIQAGSGLGGGDVVVNAGGSLVLETGASSESSGGNITVATSGGHASGDISISSERVESESGNVILETGDAPVAAGAISILGGNSGGASGSSVAFEVAELQARYTRLFGPRKMESRIHGAVAHGMEVESCTFKVRKNSFFAEPSNSEILFRAGNRLRLGNSPVVYQVTKNDGLPTVLEKITLKIRRAFVATLLHWQESKHDIRNDDDMDMVDFKSTLQRAEAEFQARIQYELFSPIAKMLGKTSHLELRPCGPKEDKASSNLDV